MYIAPLQGIQAVVFPHQVFTIVEELGLAAAKGGFAQPVVGIVAQGVAVCAGEAVIGVVAVGFVAQLGEVAGV